MADPSVEERVAVLEALQGQIASEVHEMRVNHLPHIERKVDSLRNWIMGALFSACLSLVVLIGNLIVQVVKLLA
jgi:hypothetical protein